MAEEPEPTFEDALARIERIVADLERGEPALSTALAKYEDGVKLLRSCYDLLDQAERLGRAPDRRRRARPPRHRPLRRHGDPDARARGRPPPTPLPPRPRPATANPRRSPGPPAATRPRSPISPSDEGWAMPTVRGFLSAADAHPTSIGPPSDPPKSVRGDTIHRNNPIQSAQTNFASQSFRGSRVDFRRPNVHNNLALLVRRGQEDLLRRSSRSGSGRGVLPSARGFGR